MKIKAVVPPPVAVKRGMIITLDPKEAQEFRNFIGRLPVSGVSVMMLAAMESAGFHRTVK